MDHAQFIDPSLQELPRSVRWRLQLKLLQWPQNASMLNGPTLLNQIQECNATVLGQEKERFQKLMENYVEEEVIEEDKTEDTKARPTPKEPEIDPLTAMVLEQKAQETRKAELLLKYKKERARRKRGLTTEGRQIGDETDGIDQASLIIIEKDLKRLPHPTSNNGAASGNLSPEEEQRINHLKEILYIYAQEHSVMGYRQGMHEIASYLLYALELEHSKDPDNLLYGSISATCFTMLERVLEQLELAYDASGEQAFQRLSQSILSKIRQNDPTLFHKLTTSPNIPPPPIYCTRWVRLLFSREIVDFENVFALWDILFQYYPDIMRALEMASVARILLLSRVILDPKHSPLDLLMNVPRHEAIDNLVEVSRKLVEQNESDPSITIQESHFIHVPSPPPSPSGAAGVIASAEPTLAPHIPAPQSMSTVPPPTEFGRLNRFPIPTSNEEAHSGNRAFSFSKMKDSLGKKSESLRQKIITATNEWNRENSQGGGTANNNNQFSISTDIFTAAGEVLRQGSQLQNTRGDIGGQDPLRSHHGVATMLEPPSPRKHQHKMWSQGMHERILVLQNYLMTIESSSGNNNDIEKERQKVPSKVWEAMADLQKMQQELHNYSLHMA